MPDNLLRPVFASRRFRTALVSLVTVIGLLICHLPAQARAATTCPDTPGAQDVTFSYTGSEQTCTVPDGVTSLSVTAIGGAGGGDLGHPSMADPYGEIPGGQGAEVTGTLAVTGGQTLYVEVGGNGGEGDIDGGSAGYNGGGGSNPYNYDGGGGGGASDLRALPAAAGLVPMDSRLIVAGGGGGAGLEGSHSDNSPATGDGGIGGAAGASGETAAASMTSDGSIVAGGGGGGAGSQIAGGSAGAGGVYSPASSADAGKGFNGSKGTEGSLGQGATGVEQSGSGGGGYYGGGSGGEGASYNNNNGEFANSGEGGGGGGSSLVPAGGTLTTTSSAAEVEIQYTVPAPPACTGQNVNEYLGQSTTTTISCTGTDNVYALTSEPTNGTVTLDQTHGTFTYTPANGATAGSSDSFTITATNPYGTPATDTVSVTEVGPPSATITSPANNQTYSQGASITTSFTCSEASNGPGLNSCQDSYGVGLVYTPAGDSYTFSTTDSLDTSTPGNYQYSVTATSHDGETSTTTINYTVADPPTATISSPADNQTYQPNQNVPTSFSCQDDPNGPGIESCTDSNGLSAGANNQGAGTLDTATPGTFTYSVTATSTDGQTSTTSINYTVADPPTATISSPANNQTYQLNQTVATSFSCTESTYGPGLASCTDSHGTSAGNNNQGTGQLDTSAAGSDSYSVTATSEDGQTSTTTIIYTVVGPPTATINSPNDNQTYNQGQIVPTSFSCADDLNGPGIQTCTDSNNNSSGTGQLDTSTPGQHTYTVTATSQDGQTGTQSISYTVLAGPSATIASPQDNQTYTVGQNVPTSFSCTEGSNGPGLQSCTDSRNNSTGTDVLDTTKAGSFTYTVTATSKDGQTGTATIHYTVTAPVATIPPTTTTPPTPPTTPVTPPSVPTKPLVVNLLRVGRPSVTQLIKHGELVRLSCNQACTVQVKTLVYYRAIHRGNQYARWFQTAIVRSTKITVGEKTVTFAAAGTRTVHVYLTRSAAKSLKTASSILLGVTTTPKIDNIYQHYDHKIWVTLHGKNILGEIHMLRAQRAERLTARRMAAATQHNTYLLDFH